MSLNGEGINGSNHLSRSFTIIKKLVWTLFFVTLTLLAGYGGFRAGAFYTHPLGEAMSIRFAPRQAEAAPTATAQPAAQPTLAPTATGQADQPQPATAPTATAQPTPTQQPTLAPTATTQAEQPAAVEQSAAANKGMCGETGTMLVLFTGADFSMGIPPLGADAVRLVRADFDQGRIVVVAFPRDLVVQTPALADLNLNQSPLGLAYQARKMATQGEAKHRITKATELVAQTLEDNFAYPSNAKDYYYFTLQLDEVGKMIDQTGGVEIDLPQGFTSDRGITFPAGVQTLDGRLSAEYVRAFQPGGDAARLKRQNLYMQALRKHVLDIGLLPKLPDLYKQFDKAVVTSMSPKQLQNLACLANGVAEDQIVFHEIGADNGLVTAGEGSLLIPNVEQIKAKLVEWLGQ